MKPDGSCPSGKWLNPSLSILWKEERELKGGGHGGADML